MFLDVTLKHVLLFDMVLKIVYMWVSHDIVVPIPICLCLHVGFMEKGLKNVIFSYFLGATFLINSGISSVNALHILMYK